MKKWMASSMIVICLAGTGSSAVAKQPEFDLTPQKQEAITYMSKCFLLLTRQMSETFKVPQAKTCEDSDILPHDEKKPNLVMESEISLKKQPMNGVNIRVHMKNGGWISSNSVIINKFENYLYVVDGKTSDPKNLEVELFLYSCLQSLERRDTQILSIADVRRCENPPIKSGHKKNDNVITSEVFVLKLNPKICIFDMIYISVQTKDKNWTSLVYDNTGCSYNSMPYISSGRVSKPWN